jgi:hypothetical protein
VKPTAVEVSRRLHRLAASANWIAAGCACGDWKTQISNLGDGGFIAEVPQSRAVEQVDFVGMAKRSSGLSGDHHRDHSRRNVRPGPVVLRDADEVCPTPCGHETLAIQSGC